MPLLMIWGVIGFLWFYIGWIDRLHKREDFKMEMIREKVKYEHQLPNKETKIIDI